MWMRQVYGSFRDFHAYFAPLFGRKHSGHYLQATAGATLRTCRRRFRGQPESDAAVSHRFSLGR